MQTGNGESGLRHGNDNAHEFELDYTDLAWPAALR